MLWISCWGAVLSSARGLVVGHREDLEVEPRLAMTKTVAEHTDEVAGTFGSIWNQAQLQFWEPRHPVIVFPRTLLALKVIPLISGQVALSSVNQPGLTQLSSLIDEFKQSMQMLIKKWCRS
jgi:hypothetical protein